MFFNEKSLKIKMSDPPVINVENTRIILVINEYLPRLSGPKNLPIKIERKKSIPNLKNLSKRLKIVCFK